VPKKQVINLILTVAISGGEKKVFVTEIDENIISAHDVRVGILIKFSPHRLYKKIVSIFTDS